MGKELAKKATAAAAESILESLMPELHQRLSAIEQKIDQAVETTNRHLHEQLDAINELANRVTRLEGAFGQIDKSINRQTDRMEVWIERVVRTETFVEILQKKAG